MRKLHIVLFVFVLVLACSASAQKNEIGFTVGGYVPVGTQLAFTPGVSFEGSYARRIADVPFVGLYVELPVTVTRSIGLEENVGSFQALFVTPALKVKFVPGFVASPWLSLGGGLAHYSGNATLLSQFGVSGDSSVNRGVVEFGGGLDIKVFPFISLRGQVRDYYTAGLGSLLPIPIPGIADKQHNLMGGGGVVVRF